MPNKKEHVSKGAVSGLAVAGTVAFCQDNTLVEKLIEAAGGLAGGAIGGMLADKIDLPTSPNHRSIAHGKIPNAGLLALAPKGKDLYCHLKSEAKRLASSDNPLDKAKSLLYIALAGFLVGAIAGHVSHLALDSRTPKGLPTFM